jgi:hypothetical protein
LQSQSCSCVSKSRRHALFLMLLPDIIPPCRTCLPRLVDCDCHEDACSCEADIEVVDPFSGEPCECSWTEPETYAYRENLGKALETLDPANYQAPPLPAFPIVGISSEMRLNIMESRVSAGFHLKHPKDRTSADEGRDGEIATQTINGVKKRSSVGRVPDSRHEARWAEESPRRILRDPSRII